MMSFLTVYFLSVLCSSLENNSPSLMVVHGSLLNIDFTSGVYISV